MIDGARTHDNWNHNPGLYQLSYDHHRNWTNNGLPDRNRTCNPQLRRLVLYPVELRADELHASTLVKNRWRLKPTKPKNWSAWRDSNSRHPAPKAGALPGYATRRRGRNIAEIELLVNSNMLKYGFILTICLKHNNDCTNYRRQSHCRKPIGRD